jgi:UDP-2-acetamido-2-deoxy-ribo-hexuluronate aminotransferase
MNGRMDTLQAAVVLAKFESWTWEVNQRGKLGARYSELLMENANLKPRQMEPRLIVPEVAPGNTHVYAQYTLRVPNRDAVVERLKVVGIPHAIYYPKCLHEQPCFASCGKVLGDFPEAERASREVVSLPMHPDLSEDEMKRVVAGLISIL